MGSIAPGVAAGHPDTALAGLGVLAAGGSAVDAAVAMILVGCTAETVFCGLGGGGFATVYEAASGQVHCLDFFVAVPGLDGTVAAPATDIAVEFNGVAVPYAVGGATVAVPGIPRGTAELHRRFGRLPWPSVVAPAVALAGRGVPIPAEHAELLTDVSPAMVVGAGIHAYTREEGDDRRLIRAWEHLHHPGLAGTLAVLAADGPEPLMTGTIGQDLVAAVRADGGALSLQDMAAYQVRELEPARVELGDAVVTVRGNDLDDVAGTLNALDLTAVHRGGLDRARALVAALRSPSRRAETTSLAAVDPDGNACAATHSLGLGSGVWSHGIHANSMLGEGELLREAMSPGARMPSMMVPMVATGPAGDLVFAGGAAGGSRIRPAVVQVLTAMVLQGASASAAVAAPRLSATADTVHLEPGFPPEVAEGLRSDGNVVVEWPERRPYFGGASVIGRGGAAADPRRGGAAFALQ
jgi:gamma-glutamyltranspeptidase/glutathione hydrolase